MSFTYTVKDFYFYFKLVLMDIFKYIQLLKIRLVVIKSGILIIMEYKIIGYIIVLN